MGSRPLPRSRMSYLTMAVLDWSGPIVEIGFNRRVDDADDVELLVAEAERFTNRTVRPHADRAAFVTCYDGISVATAVTKQLSTRFADFNREYSIANVRYDGSAFAKTFVIATSIHERSGANLHPDRESAVAALRELIAGQQATPAGSPSHRQPGG